MKKGKMIVLATALLVASAGTFAFKSANYHPANLRYLDNSINPVCKASTNATSDNTGSAPTHEADFGDGYFANSDVNCTGQKVQAFQATGQ